MKFALWNVCDKNPVGYEMFRKVFVSFLQCSLCHGCKFLVASLFQSFDMKRKIEKSKNKTAVKNWLSLLLWNMLTLITAAAYKHIHTATLGFFVPYTITSLGSFINIVNIRRFYAMQHFVVNGNAICNGFGGTHWQTLQWHSYLRCTYALPRPMHTNGRGVRSSLKWSTRLETGFVLLFPLEIHTYVRWVYGLEYWKQF